MHISRKSYVGHWGGVGQVDLVNFVVVEMGAKRNRLVEGRIEKQR